MNWTELATIASSIITVATFVAVVFATLIYRGQLRAMNRARDLESLLAILKYVDDLELRQARYFMNEHAEELRKLYIAPFTLDKRRAIDAKIRELSSGSLELHNIDLCLSSLNNICYFIRYDFAPADLSDGLLENTLIHAWDVFKEYVSYRRTRESDKNLPSRYAEQFEWVIDHKSRPVKARGR